MVLASLREALGLLRTLPVLWLTGAMVGIIMVLGILVGYLPSNFLGGRALGILLIVFPFFIAGSWGVIRSGKGTLSAYLSCGWRYYFAVLLPAAVVLSAAVLTLLLLMIPLGLVTGGSAMAGLPFLVAGVLVPFAFFTFFSGAAAVFEGRKVLDSIRRSIEFTVLQPGKTILFFGLQCLIALGTFFLGSFLWTLFIAFPYEEQLTPLLQMNATRAPDVVLSSIASIIGPWGMAMTIMIVYLLAMAWGTVLFTHAACFFRKYAGDAEPSLPPGEYDAKGRWYRY